MLGHSIVNTGYRNFIVRYQHALHSISNLQHNMLSMWEALNDMLRILCATIKKAEIKSIKHCSKSLLKCIVCIKRKERQYVERHVFFINKEYPEWLQYCCSFYYSMLNGFNEHQCCNYNGFPKQCQLYVPLNLKASL